MINFNEDVNNRKYFKSDMLYHYTSLNTAMEKILSSQKLRFSSFRNVNDPSEKINRSLGYLYSNVEGDNSSFRNNNHYEEMNKIRLDESKLL